MVKRAKLRKITAGLLAFMLVTSALPVGNILPIDSGVSFGITASAADGVYTIGNATVTYTKGDDNNVTITDVIANGDTSIEIPETIDGGTVTTIGDSAFMDCTTLESITLPPNITSIESEAFLNCTALTDITIPDKVTKIEAFTFDGCKSLANITIPSKVESIGSGAFLYCTALTDIKIPDSVKSIGSAAFSSCTSLTDITIPDGVTVIGSNVFSNCTSLTDITIPDSVESIGIGAFSSCNSLKSVVIPAGVTSVGMLAFSGCTSLKAVFAKEGLSLESTSIPNSAAKIKYEIRNCYAYILEIIPDNSNTPVVIPDTICGYEVMSTAEEYRQYVSETGHTHKGGTATCTEKAICDICGKSYESTDLTNHNADTSVWKYDENGHWNPCLRAGCEAHLNAAAHISDNGTVTKPATKTEEGVRTYKCTVCGYVMRTETIPVIKPDYYPNYNPNYNTYTPSVSVTPSYNFEQIKPTGKISKNSVTLKWTDVEDADKYTVYQLVDGKYKAIKTTTENTYTVKNLPTGKHKFIVRYTVDGKISPISKSEVITVNIKNSKPYPTATVKGNIATLKWQPVDNAEKYAIYLVKDGKATKLKETEKASVRYKLKPGKEYQFVVRAYVDGKWTTMKTSDIVKVTAEE